MKHPTRGPSLLLCLAFSLLLTLPTPGWPADSGNAPMAGGWSAAPLQDEPVRRAAAFAVQEQNRKTNAHLRLLSIKHARIQVVAGVNYSMNLMVESEGKRRLIIAVVWVHPDGTQELTGWHWV